MFASRDPQIQIRLLLIATMLFGAAPAFARNKPHYIFLLPDGYTGWIQVISQSSNSPAPIAENDNLVIDLDNSGVFRTPTFHTISVGAHDEFFYKHVDEHGTITRVAVPITYVCAQSSGLDSCYTPSEEHGADGFTVGRATVGKSGPSSEGVSWFLFVGPPELRARKAVPVTFEPGTKKMMDHPESDPIPGRINP